MRLGRTHRKPRAHHFGRRAIAVRTLLALLAATLVLALLPAGTSVAEEHPGGEEPAEEEPTEEEFEEAEEADDSNIELLDHRIPLPEGAKQHKQGAGRVLWTVPQVRRGFVLASPVKSGYQELVAMDLDTGDEVGRIELDPPAWRGDGHGDLYQSGLESGQPHTVAVDRDGGRLFVAYGISSGETPTPLVETDANLHTQRVQDGDDPCASVEIFLVFQTGNLTSCFKGIHIIDAVTLEVLDSIELDPRLVDGWPDVHTGLRAMTYSPPRTTTEPGKLHLLVEELGHQHRNSSLVHGRRTRSSATGLRYAAQVDVDAGRLDWAVRVNACRQAREQDDELQMREYTADRPHPQAIFRDADLVDQGLWIGCHGGGQGGVVVRVPLDDAGNPFLLPVRGDGAERVLGRLSSAQTVDRNDVMSAREETWVGPAKVEQMLVDPTSQRLLMKSVASGEVWWVFDIQRRAFIGTLGISQEYGQPTPSSAGLDPSTSRLYVLGPEHAQSGKTEGGGLWVAQVGDDPLGQALKYPRFAELTNTVNGGMIPLSVAPGLDGQPTRIYAYQPNWPNPYFAVLEDRTPVRDPSARSIGVPSLDIDEQDGVTARSIDGAARGYGARAILVGGLEAVARAGPIDSGGHYPLNHFTPLPRTHECSQRTRDVTVGFVGPDGAVTVDNGGSAATAVPLMVDAGTRKDPEQPITRCTPWLKPGSLDAAGKESPQGYDEVWSDSGVSGKPLVDEPGTEWPFGNQAECVSSDEDPEDDVEDPHAGRFQAHVSCGEQGSDGHSRARGMGVEGVVVGQVWSTYDIYLDPDRGLVSRMASMARGVVLGAADGPRVEIDTVKAVAESWANGRAQPPEVLADQQDPDYDPNCDRRRTAGTCFERHLLGVRIVDQEGEQRYSCGPCGDEQALINGMDAVLGTEATVRFREPDPLLARGADNGSQAAVQKAADEGGADANLNQDLLETTLPALEIIRYAPPTRQLATRGMPAPVQGRQVFHLAGVETSSKYEVQCLLVVHPDGSCAPPAAKPGTVTVTLEDTDGEPLEGGLFEVYADPTGDGLLGLDDPLAGTCVTDTKGSCSIEELQPGSYLVHQSAAPAGYAPGGEVPISIASGESWTVQFTNIAQAANIEIALVDADDERPLKGGVFEAWVDDGDGVVGAADVRTATCTTDAEGSCVMSGVPLGGFVVAQKEAPRMYSPAEPVAFALSQPGQTARVTVVNASAASEIQSADDGAAGTTADVPPAQGSIDVDTTTPQQLAAPGTAPVRNRSVSLDAPAAPPAPVVAPSAPPPTVPQQIVALPRDAWDFAAREPVQAAAYGAIWLLLATAGGAVWRRRAVAQLLATT